MMLGSPMDGSGKLIGLASIDQESKIQNRIPEIGLVAGLAMETCWPAWFGLNRTIPVSD